MHIKVARLINGALLLYQLHTGEVTRHCYTKVHILCSFLSYVDPSIKFFVTDRDKKAPNAFVTEHCNRFTILPVHSYGKLQQK